MFRDDYWTPRPPKQICEIAGFCPSCTIVRKFHRQVTQEPSDFEEDGCLLEAPG